MTRLCSICQRPLPRDGYGRTTTFRRKPCHMGCGWKARSQARMQRMRDRESVRNMALNFGRFWNWRENELVDPTNAKIYAAPPTSAG